MSIRHGLLALLERGPSHGYQLRAEFDAATGATWPLNVGQVYSTLDRLERDGLVVQDGEPDTDGRIAYRITDVGQAELRGWFASPVSAKSAPRDELAIKLALAVTTPGVDVLRVVQTHKQHLFFVAMQPQVSRVLEGMGVLKLIRPGHIYATRLEALRCSLIPAVP